MKTALVPSRRFLAVRAAFTLVEMLVALSIFLILATLTLGAFKGVNKSDQVSAGAQQVKGWFEHARSLAIKEKQPRGIRFQADVTSATGSTPHLCSTVAYIGSAGYEDGDMTPVVTPATDWPQRKYLWIQPSPRGLPSASPTTTFPAGTILSPGGIAFNQPPTSASSYGYATYLAWQAAKDSGALTTATATLHGLRIEIPRNSGNWYPILAVGEDLDGNGTFAAANEDWNGSESSGSPTGRADPVIFLATPVANAAQYAGRPVDYRIELGPTVLPGKANALPRGIVIDLDGSDIPWRPVFPKDGGAVGGSYPAQMDVMFSPQGTFVGQLAAATGVMHLLVTTLDDANATRNAFTTAHPEEWTSTSSNPVCPVILADPKTPQRVVSVSLTSGRIASSNVFMFLSTDPFTDGFQNTRLGSSPSFKDVSRAFGYALQGKESK